MVWGAMVRFGWGAETREMGKGQEPGHRLTRDPSGKPSNSSRLREMVSSFWLEGWLLLSRGGASDHPRMGRPIPLDTAKIHSTLLS
jgi:hypothetical protein